MPNEPAPKPTESPTACADGSPPVAMPLTLQTKAILGIGALVVVSTGLCAYLTATVAEQAMQRTMRMDAEVLMQTSGRVLSHYLTRRDHATAGHLDDLLEDERVAFIVLTDAQGRTLQRRIADPCVWQTFQQNKPEAVSRSAIGQSVELVDGETHALVRGRALFVPAEESAGSISARHGEPNPQLLGYLWIGFRDRGTPAMRELLWAGVLGVVCLVTLVALPVVILLVRRLTRPLRSVIVAIHRFSSGQMPDPLPVSQDDEIGLLIRSFNTMANNLSRARDQLERTNLYLEEMVRQRTDELEEANRKLQQEMRDKDDFVRTISHDLNAPVRNIAGLTKMLLLKHEAELTEDVLEKLERIAANARVESELLGDLLELNRIKSQPGKTQAVDLNELLASIADSLSFDIEARKIELSIQPRLPVIHADRNRIRQVFQNLIDNAIKYMPADASNRRIEVGQCGEEYQFAFYVSDTGRGIDEKDRHRIFQIFQRARYSGHDDTPGRGVGLASVKTIVESYGGQVRVCSRPGHGTCFRFTLDMGLFSHCPLNAAEEEVCQTGGATGE